MCVNVYMRTKDISSDTLDTPPPPVGDTACHLNSTDTMGLDEPSRPLPCVNPFFKTKQGKRILRGERSLSDCLKSVRRRPASGNSCLLPSSISKWHLRGTRQHLDTSNPGRISLISSVPLPQGQDKSVTLRVTRWPDLFSPLQSLSMTPTFPASLLLSSLADIIYCSKMNREASLCPPERRWPTGIHPQFCRN